MDTLSSQVSNVQCGSSTDNVSAGASVGAWWDDWVTSAKSKSAEVFTIFKRDLDEITTAVKSTTTNVLKLDEPESTANVMKKSFSTFIGQVSSALSPIPYNDEDDTEIVFSSGDTTMLSTYKRELEALQRVDATFIVSAESPEFDAWRSTKDGTDEIITPQSAYRKMEDSPVLKSQYEKLVPDAVSHDEFWERYLFRLALLHDRLAAASRKQPIKEESTDPVIAHLPMIDPPEPIQQSPKKVMPSPIVSDDDFETEVNVWQKETTTDVELTEEQQILLLEEYEKEISSKKNVKTNNNNNRKNKQKKCNRDKLNNKPLSDELKEDGGENQDGGQNKEDQCGNLVEDYFGKDDASANSDSSWEKEFDLDEMQKT